MSKTGKKRIKSELQEQTNKLLKKKEMSSNSHALRTQRSPSPTVSSCSSDLNLVNDGSLKRKAKQELKQQTTTKFNKITRNLQRSPSPSVSSCSSDMPAVNRGRKIKQELEQHKTKIFNKKSDSSSMQKVQQKNEITSKQKNEITSNSQALRKQISPSPSVTSYSSDLPVANYLKKSKQKISEIKLQTSKFKKSALDSPLKSPSFLRGTKFPSPSPSIRSISPNESLLHHVNEQNETEILRAQILQMSEKLKKLDNQNLKIPEKANIVEDENKENQLYGKNYKKDDMVLLANEIYCRKNFYHYATSNSYKASHTTRRLIEGVFTKHAIKNCTLSGQAPKNLGKVRKMEKRKLLDPEARKTIIEFSQKLSKRKGWHFQDTYELNRCISQKLCELKRQYIKNQDSSDSDDSDSEL